MARTREKLKGQYIEAKAKYHKLGRDAEGTPKGSPERRAYEEAGREYHRLGEMLRNIRQH